MLGVRLEPTCQGAELPDVDVSVEQVGGHRGVQAVCMQAHPALGASAHLQRARPSHVQLDATPLPPMAIATGLDVGSSRPGGIGPQPREEPPKRPIGQQQVDHVVGNAAVVVHRKFVPQDASVPFAYPVRQRIWENEAMKRTKVIINGHPLSNVLTQVQTDYPTGTNTYIGAGNPEVRQDGDDLSIHIEPLAIAQLYYDGVLPQDRDTPITVAIGRKAPRSYRIESLATRTNRWNRTIALLSSVPA